MPYIYINWNYIERVSQAKVIGVTVSSDFNWNALIDYIVSNNYYSIRCSTLVRKYDIVLYC